MRLCFWTIGLLIALAACSWPTRGETPDARQLGTEQRAAVDTVVQAEQEKQQVVGVAVGIIQGGQIVYTKGYGWADRENERPMTAQTVVNWASNSKPIAALLAMQLVAAGKLDLDADVRKYVPEFPDKGEVIKVRHLLCHQSGIPHYSNGKVIPTERAYNVPRPYLDPVLSLDKFNRSPLIFSPGTKTDYSSYAYILLSAVVQRAGGQPFLDQVQERISGPLGMKSLALDVESTGQRDWAAGYVRTNGGDVVLAPEDANYWKHGAGGFKANVEDFARWGVGLLGRKLLDEKTERLMWSRQTTADGNETTWGLGFTVEEQGGLKVSHNGAQDEATSRMVLYPESKSGVVVLTNCRFANPGAFSTAVYAALGGK